MRSASMLDNTARRTGEACKRCVKCLLCCALPLHINNSCTRMKPLNPRITALGPNLHPLLPPAPPHHPPVCPSSWEGSLHQVSQPAAASYPQWPPRGPPAASAAAGSTGSAARRNLVCAAAEQSFNFHPLSPGVCAAPYKRLASAEVGMSHCQCISASGSPL